MGIKGLGSRSFSERSYWIDFCIDVMIYEGLKIHVLWLTAFMGMICHGALNTG